MTEHDLPEIGTHRRQAAKEHGIPLPPESAAAGSRADVKAEAAAEVARRLGIPLDLAAGVVEMAEYQLESGPYSGPPIWLNPPGLDLDALVCLADERETVAFTEHGTLSEDHFALGVIADLGKAMLEHRRLSAGERRNEEFVQEWAQTLLSLVSWGRMYVEVGQMEEALQAAPSELRRRFIAERATRIDERAAEAAEDSQPE